MEGKVTAKAMMIVLGTILLAAVLVVAGFAAGAIWGQTRWDLDTQAAESGEWMGLGMMGPGWEDRPYGPAQDVPCAETCPIPSEGDAGSLEDVEATVHDYVQRLGYTGLYVTEIMEFDLNYYAIVAEEETGIGAMELLVDKDSGAVGPEPGPNMMWNAKYGMHRGRGMMVGTTDGPATDDMPLSPSEAEDLAQHWLDANLPGRVAGDADPFYGYYTLHFFNDGRIEGMLSVHGSSGSIWYHSWHGDFIAMTEGHS